MSLSPETVKALEIVVTAVASGGMAALGNSRATRRTVAKLLRRVGTLEKGQAHLVTQVEESKQQHSSTGRALAYLHGAVHLVGTALGQKFGLRGDKAAHATPAVAGPNPLKVP